MLPDRSRVVRHFTLRQLQNYSVTKITNNDLFFRISPISDNIPYRSEYVKFAEINERPCITRTYTSTMLRTDAALSLCMLQNRY